MNVIRTNTKIERNALIKGIVRWVPAIQNGYFAAPRLLEETDYIIFQKTTKEKELLYTLKARNKADRKQEFGKNAKRFLNITVNQIKPTIHYTF